MENTNFNADNNSNLYEKPKVDNTKLIYSNLSDNPFHNPFENLNDNPFNEQSIRIGFRNKVLGIVSIQMLFTVGICALFMENHKMNELMNGPHKTALYILATIATFVTLFVMMCVPKYRYHYPHNYILLTLFTASLSYTVALVCIQYQTYSVIYAGIATCVVCFGLIIYAIKTNNDFTTMGAGLSSALVILIVMGIIGSFIRDSVYNFVYSGLGAFIFSLYLIYDIQMVSSGNHKYELSPDDYIMGAIAIYLDIINIFLDILNLVGARRD
tara:strand:+ start:3732 stop:4541 length:810 start_codon:yes stop_codon:yes gene_type:complete